MKIGRFMISEFNYKINYYYLLLNIYVYFGWFVLMCKVN